MIDESVHPALQSVTNFITNSLDVSDVSAVSVGF